MTSFFVDAESGEDELFLSHSGMGARPGTRRFMHFWVVLMAYGSVGEAHASFVDRIRGVQGAFILGNDDLLTVFRG